MYDLHITPGHWDVQMQEKVFPDSLFQVPPFPHGLQPMTWTVNNHQDESLIISLFEDVPT